VVVVTINYRLGALGFSHLADVGGERWAFSANCGLLDQVAALGWVRDNIEAFGGDPDRITIFGESAGSISVATLLGTPAAAGLFHQAIMQSGATNLDRDREQANRVTASLLAALGGGLDDLVAAPVERILEAQLKVMARQSATSSEGSLAFSPVVDGTTLPVPPLDAVRNGAAAGVRTLIGSNHDEATMFLVFVPKLADLSWEDLHRRGERLMGERWSAMEAGYRAGRPDAAPFDVLCAFMTDFTFRIASIELAEAQGVHAPTWMYRFDWPTPAFDGRLGAAHALDLPFVWDVLGRHGSQMFTGDAPPEELARRMHGDWLAFGCGEDLGWPRYDTASRSTMIYNAVSQVVDDPDGAERRLWQ
jgi:para-nitrobenzyl esterase